MIEIREVKTKKDRKAFVTFPFKLYKNNEYYVPSLRMDEVRIFDSRCDYAEVTNNVFFLAYKDGELVGRIHGIEQLQYNEIYKTKQIRFTRFDSINDQAVANALFDAVINWGRSKGMDTIVGPLGFSDLEREGLLIEGFEEKQTYAEQYNYSYYKDLIENYGFEKDIDWLEFNLTKKEDLDPRAFTVGDMIMKRNKLSLVPIDNISKGKYFKKYYKQFFALLDEAYRKLYGVVPSTKKLEDSLVQTLGFFIPKEDFRLIVDPEGKLVAFALLMPNLSDALIKSKGRITIPFLFRVLKTIRKPKMVDFMLIGVDPQYLSKAIPACFLKLIYDMFDNGVESFETNLNLETNRDIINCWKYFNARQHKRRRCFRKAI
ncbi:MAG: hypothetical protein MJZ37_07205 [Bacilli bacterium]|nr:hypothetical protein [Bacilli bacterium]